MDFEKRFNQETKAWAIQGGILTAFHPFEYTKTLIQLGYEPFQPTEKKFFGAPCLALPNIFQYMKYIKSVDGFFGLYRGLSPRLFEMTIGYAAYSTISHFTPKSIVQDDDDDDEETVTVANPSTSSLVRYQPLSSDIKKVAKTTAWEYVCVSVRTIVSHPFHVVAVRTMAQFVGRETVYSTPWKGLVEIYNTEGVKGFFSGLVPRLIAEGIFLVVSTSLYYLGTKYIFKDKNAGTICSLPSNILAGSLSYPFHVVSKVMTVNGSTLLVGNPPFTIYYQNWYQCWKDLSQLNQLKRGSSIIGRYYVGRSVVINGRLIPTGFNFGPIHMPKMD